MTALTRKDAALTSAWLIALTASLSALFIGEVLGQRPCDLCWFQRAFMFPLAIVLGLGVWWGEASVARYGFVLALGGAAVALWHSGLYAGLIPDHIQPCSPDGPSCTGADQRVLGLPMPLLSFLSFGLIAALCLPSRTRRMP